MSALLLRDRRDSVGARLALLLVAHCDSELTVGDGARTRPQEARRGLGVPRSHMAESGRVASCMPR